MSDDDPQARRRGVYWLPNLLSGGYALSAPSVWSFRRLRRRARTTRPAPDMSAPRG